MSLWLKIHLITIIPVLLLGPFIFVRPKGKGLHALMGRIWAILMLVSCLTTFGIKYHGTFSWLHGLSLFTMYSVGKAIYAVRKGDLKQHKQSMVGAYTGALIAFIWATSSQGRLLNVWLLDLIR